MIWPIGNQRLRIAVVFDGYGSSTKDHDHLRRTKNSCCNILIRPDIKNIVPREKFLDNNSNKAQLIRLLAETFCRNGISVQQCPDDADTSIVRKTLDEAREFPVEVRAADTDVMVMLIYHAADYPIFLTTAKETSYDRYRKDPRSPTREIPEVPYFLAQLLRLRYSLSDFWVWQINIANQVLQD